MEPDDRLEQVVKFILFFVAPLLLWVAITLILALVIDIDKHDAAIEALAVVGIWAIVYRLALL